MCAYLERERDDHHHFCEKCFFLNAESIFPFFATTIFLRFVQPEWIRISFFMGSIRETKPAFPPVYTTRTRLSCFVGSTQKLDRDGQRWDWLHLRQQFKVSPSFPFRCCLCLTLPALELGKTRSRRKKVSRG